jgi:hypothetical protein
VGGTPNVPKGLQVYSRSVYYGVASSTNAQKGVIMNKESRTDFKDAKPVNSTFAAPGYKLKSAPLPLPKTNNYRVSGLELIMKSDAYAITDISLIADLGVKETGDLNLPDQGSNIAKPFASLGMDATYVQYQLEHDGSTTTPASVGLELYGVNVHFQQGGAR